MRKTEHFNDCAHPNMFTNCRRSFCSPLRIRVVYFGLLPNDWIHSCRDRNASGLTFVEIREKTAQTGVPVLTCWCVLQQLFELCRGELCACGGHEHSNLCELGFDIGLLQITEECGGGDPFGRAIRSTFHQINNHLSPTKAK